MLSDCDFQENRRSESHILLTGVNEFLSARSTFIIRLVWRSVDDVCA